MISAPLRIPIGLSDFCMLREGGYTYVDKTRLIEAVLCDTSQVLLLPRPRRFGKTLNLSMLRYFFEKSAEDLRPLFAGLDVASSDVARPHFGRYPIIFLTFKDIKPSSWEQCVAGMAHLLAEEYERHAYLLAGGSISAADAALFTAIRERKAASTDLVIALRHLSRLLAEYHGEKVLILIDEYDSPIHAGYTKGYYDDVVAFFRDFLSGGLKDNRHLFKGILTGILCIAKESLFSGLNNVVVYGLLRAEYAPYFGFTEPEVQALCDAAGQPDQLADIRAFYNGYLFGEISIYNPWSVLSFLHHPKNLLLPYWIDTSSNDLVRELLLTGQSGAREELEVLLAGGAVEQSIEENVVLRDLVERPDTVWSFLLFTGYLKPLRLRLEKGDYLADLCVPNVEVNIALRKMVRGWMMAQAGSEEALDKMLSAMLRGDAKTVERYLSRIAKVNASYFDTAGPEPERFYHGLVVGLVAGLESTHEVRSNRESGYGRCDVMILPKTPGNPGVVIELKRIDAEEGESKEAALSSALAQIRARDYASELRERGAAPVVEMAAVFDGKRAYVRVG